MNDNTEYIATNNNVKCQYCGRHYNNNFTTQCPSCSSTQKQKLKHWER